jgi:hypothetical protein
MKRLVQLGVLLALAAYALRRVGVSLALGVVLLDEPMLSQRAANPTDMTVVGIADIPSGTPPQLVGSAIRKLRIAGILRGDHDALQALKGRTRVFGAIETRDH